MDDLFTSLTRIVEGGSWLALLGAVVWGVLSILLSPCHLASVPLIVGFLNEQGCDGSRRGLVISATFAFGILISIGVIGVITAAAGRLMGDLGAAANFTVAIVLILIGLHLLGAIHIPWFAPAMVGPKRTGIAAALVLGAIFGAAVGPCTFAYMAPMLAVSLREGAVRPVFSTMLIVLFGVGHCGVIVAAGTATGLVQRYLDWQERSRSGYILKCICGVLVVVGGVWFLLAAI